MLRDRIALIGLTTLLCFFTQGLWARGATLHAPTTLAGVVVAVHDGDTLRIRGEDGRVTRIRVAGIDAPEVCQRYWKASRDRLRALVVDKRDVRVVTYKTDVYGREVARVYVGTQDVGIVLVEEGLAWHARRYENEQTASERLALRDAEAKAHAAHRGLWSQPSPEAPWKFRRRTHDARPIKPCYS